MLQFKCAMLIEYLFNVQELLCYYHAMQIIQHLCDVYVLYMIYLVS